MTDWCFSGPIENWRYGIDRAAWATNNEHNHPKWFAEMASGDNVVIYISRGVGVVGYCTIDEKATKDEPWWPDEITKQENLYPNVIYIRDIVLVADIRDYRQLPRLALGADEWRACGLTQRNITGGVNVIRSGGVFEGLKHELMGKIRGDSLSYWPSSEGTQGVGYIREAIANYITDDVSPVLEQSSGLDTSDIDRDVTAERIETVVQLWRRNTWIVEQRKRSTDNRCEIPGCDYIPFEKPSGGEYSEGHHVIPLGMPGSESVRNIAILCPNHHREIHYGARREELTAFLKRQKNL